MKVLVIVDMQNDFITGSLANNEALRTVDKIAVLAASFKGLIVFTRDTHQENYLATQEGKKLPVIHCLKDSEGWQINETIYQAALNNKEAKITIVDKPNFGSGTLLFDTIKEVTKPTEIIFCGTCTDICVVSNALILKAFFPEVPIKVIESCCSGLTKEKHKAALEVMQSCQVEII